MTRAPSAALPSRAPASPAAPVSAVSAVLIALVALVALVGVQVGAADAAHARGAAGSYQKAAYDATNAERRQLGLTELRPQRCLQRAAVKQAKAMAAGQQMFHQDIGKLLGPCGLTLVGENVAYGFLDGTGVVQDGWMESLGHRANILNPAFRLMGLAARRSQDGTWYVAQVFGRSL